MLYPLRTTIIEFAINANLITLCALIILLVMVYINPLFNKKKTTEFIFAIGILIAAILVTSFDFAFSFLKLENMYIGRRITSFLNFSLSPFVAIILYRISCKDKIKNTIFIPAAINTLVCFASMFVNLVFFISTDNSYSRGVFFLLPIVTTMIYVAMIIFNQKKEMSQIKHTESVFLFFSIFLIVVALLLEVIFFLRFIIWGIASVIVISYYLLMNINERITDVLTGVYNRSMYDRDLSYVEKNDNTVLAIFDINDFKTINDTMGHSIGDEFLKKFARLLDKNFSQIATVYRIGGDEFFCIGGKKLTFEKFEELLETFRIESGFHSIKFACGATRFVKGDDLDAVLEKADKLMYQDKQRQRLEKRQSINAADLK